jgi:hypothetical protein
VNKKPRLGRVIFDLGYVVDLDNDDMVTQAKEFVYEDIMSAFKYDEVFNYIEVVEAPDAKESEIPEFLLPQNEDEN